MSLVLCSAEGAADRVSHQVIFLSSPDVMIVLSLESLRSHTTDLIVPSWCPTSLALEECWRSNTRSLFSCPPVATSLCDEEMSTVRTMCSCTSVSRVSPEYVSHNFLLLAKGNSPRSKGIGRTLWSRHWQIRPYWRRCWVWQTKRRPIHEYSSNPVIVNEPCAQEKFRSSLP